MTKKALVIVDFDNIETALRTDLSKLEMAIFSAVTQTSIYNEIQLRLYGGWLHFNNASIGARHLAPWVLGFPHVINQTIIRAELAQSLGFENHSLPNTFRSRTKRLSIQVAPSKICKQDSSCDLYRLASVITTGRCSKGNCKKSLSDAFLVNEQKLVDSMISIDLLHYSSTLTDDIYLISSDDDFVPALRYIGYRGSIVRVIHTKVPPYQFRQEYTSGYNSCILEGSI